MHPAIRATLATACALSLAPAVVRADTPALAANYRVASDQTTYEVNQWEAECGPRPTSRTGTTRAVQVTVDGSNLVFEDGHRHYRTDQCWSLSTRIRRVSAQGSAPNWTVTCETPADDLQRERGTYTITADGPRVTMRDATDSTLQMRSGTVCHASAVRTIVYERADLPVDAGVVAVPTPAPVPVVPPPAVPAATRCDNPGGPVRFELRPSRRSLVPGARTCFHLRAYDIEQCEVPAASVTGVQWAIAPARGGGSASDPTMEGSCVRAPAGSPVATFTVTATLGAVTARGTAAVVSPEEFRSLIAQHIEDDDTGGSPVTAPRAPSGSSVGTVAGTNGETTAPASPLRWIALGVALLGGLGVLVALVRRARRPEPVVEPVERVSMAPARPVDRPAPVPSPMPAAAPVSAPAPLSKRCPVCDKRFTAENAFCPEHGVTLVNVDGSSAVAPGRVSAVPAAPVTIARMPATDAHSSPAVALPLLCPKCGRRFPVATAFCGEDGSTLVNA